MAIMKCVCHSEYQDNRYGPGNRVCNQSGKKDKLNTFRCTVCGKEIIKGGVFDKKKKGK